MGLRAKLAAHEAWHGLTVGGGLEQLLIWAEQLVQVLALKKEGDPHLPPPPHVPQPPPWLLDFADPKKPNSLEPPQAVAMRSELTAFLLLIGALHEQTLLTELVLKHWDRAIEDDDALKTWLSNHRSEVQNALLELPLRLRLILDSCAQQKKDDPYAIGERMTRRVDDPGDVVSMRDAFAAAAFNRALGMVDLPAGETALGRVLTKLEDEIADVASTLDPEASTDPLGPIDPILDAHPLVLVLGPLRGMLAHFRARARSCPRTSSAA